MYDTIIVPLEGSVHCEQAVPIARDEACRHQSGIVLLYVIPRPELPVPDPRVTCSGPRIQAPDCSRSKIAGATRLGQEYLEEVRGRYGLPDGTTMRVVVGEPVKRILAEAERWPQSLIVMTTGEVEGSVQSKLSDVTRRVLIHATVPVMAVHAMTPVNMLHAPVFTGASIQSREFAMV